MIETKRPVPRRNYSGVILRSAVVKCAVALCAFSPAFPTSLPAQEQQQQQQDQKPSADKTKATADAPLQDSTTAAAGKPASKPKHVITNDDIKPSPYTSFGGLFYMSSGAINDCDASCFDQVRAMAMANSDTNPNWRRDVLRQIELVRSDGEWQAYLHDVYTAHNKICQLTFDRQDELRRSGGSFRNLGPQQIAITEKYDQQTKAGQDELSAQVARQRQIQKKFVEQPYANAFANIQGTRMMAGFCSQAKVIYPEIIR
jgi:hypothetical protein